MSSSTTTGTTSATTSTASTIEDEIISTLVSFIPALSPYAAPLALGFQLVSTVAPALYSEIQGLVAQIQAGGDPSPAEIAALQALIVNLQNPDNYFGGPVAISSGTPPAPAATAAQTTLASDQTPAAATASAAPAVVNGFIQTTVNAAGFHVAA